MTKTDMQAEMERLRAENEELRDLMRAVHDGLEWDAPEVWSEQNSLAHRYRNDHGAAGIRGALGAVLDHGIAARFSTLTIREERTRLAARFPYTAES